MIRPALMFAAVLIAAPAAAQEHTHAHPTADEAAQPGTLAPASAARLRGMMHSAYPPLLRDAGVGGEVRASLVVLADGSVDRSSIRIQSADHETFGDATGQLLPRLRFVPAPGGAMRLHVTLVWAPEGTSRLRVTGSERI